VPGATAVVAYRRFNNGKISLVSTDPDSFNDRVVAYAIFSILLAPLTLVVAATAWDYWFEVKTPDRAVSRLHRDDWHWLTLAMSTIELSVLYLGGPAIGGFVAAKIAKLRRTKFPPKTIYTTAWDAMFARLTNAADPPKTAAILRWRVGGERPIWQAGAFGKNSSASLVAWEYAPAMPWNAIRGASQTVGGYASERHRRPVGVGVPLARPTGSHQTSHGL